MTKSLFLVEITNDKEIRQHSITANNEKHALKKTTEMCKTYSTNEWKITGKVKKHNLELSTNTHTI